LIGGAAWWFLSADRAAEPATDKPIAALSSSARAETTSSLEAAGPSAAAGIADSGDVALQSTGYVIPAHQILVSPKVSGMVVALNFEEGLRVQKGDVLAELESVDYKADVARAAAVLESTRHRLLELTRGNRP